MGDARKSAKRTGIASALILPLAGLAAQNASASSSGTASNGYGPGKAASPTQAPQNSQYSFASYVQTMGEQQFSGVFGGAELQPDGSVLIHSIPGRDGSFRQAVAKAHSDPEIMSETRTGGSNAQSYSFVPASNSIADLNRVTSQIASDNSSLRANGIQLAHWGPDVPTNKVMIVLQQYSEDSANYLTSRYGSSFVEVSTQSDPVLPHRDSQFYDTPPWWSGDSIWPLGVSPEIFCTASWPLHDNSNNHYNLTAGHCQTGESNYWDTNFSSVYQYGTNSGVYFWNNGPDFELLGVGSNGDYQWTNGGSSIQFSGYISPAVGDNVTFNGAAENWATGYEVRNVGIQQVNQCITFSDGVTTCGLDTGHEAAINVCLPGDSGGPVYQYESGKNYVKAAGVIIGSTNDDTTCYFHPMSVIFNDTGLSLG